MVWLGSLSHRTKHQLITMMVPSKSCIFVHTQQFHSFCGIPGSFGYIQSCSALPVCECGVSPSPEECCYGNCLAFLV